MQRKAPRYNTDQENVFSAGQNALIAFNAEKYYRAMLQGGGQTWNIRDTHMMETLDRLMHFHGKDGKAIVWAHNTHIGDARATDMSRQGMHNIGELARNSYGPGNVSLVGFGSHHGSVVASHRWGEESQHMKVPPAISGSWEDILKRTGIQNGYLLMDHIREARLKEFEIGHRAIGVIYHPGAEKQGNYVPSVLPSRYDAFIFLEQTKALHALHVDPIDNQIPETYPFGV